MSEERSSIGMVVLPSIVSGIGVLLVLIGIFIDHGFLRNLCLATGVLLLWSDFFITMAIFRRTVRTIESQLARIESRLSDR
ncbi:MAG: hypothetical protein AB7N24_18185 [Dehalococcoidia bacterium]